jgi:hypothetical protein
MVIKTGIDWAKKVWRRGTRRWGEKKKLETKARKLEKYRAEAVQIIANYQATIEAMAQRPRGQNDPLDEKMLDSTRKRIGEILDSAKSASSKSTLRDLEENASEQETYRAYLCPRGEIGMEGKLATNLIEWWGIPKTETETLRRLLEQKLETEDDDPGCARSALQKVYKEVEEWGDYREEYEDLMASFARYLFVDAFFMPIIAAVCIYYAFLWPPLVVCGFLLAGIAGGCVSVLTKLPALEGSPSEKMDSYERRIWSRIGVGVAASLGGCGLLGWGLISFSAPTRTFSELLSLSVSPPQSVPSQLLALRMLVPLAVCILFGFSERALVSFDGVLSHTKRP